MIKYVCTDCLGHNNYYLDAINEVGRKYCDICGNNEDNLKVLSEEEYNWVLRQKNEPRKK